MLRAVHRFGWMLLFMACSSKEPAPSKSNQGGNTFAKSFLLLQVDHFAIGGGTVIDETNRNAYPILLELQLSGRFILDGGSNECNGVFTTDRVSTIDFQSPMICTQAPGDSAPFIQFKETLTGLFSQYQVNADSSRVKLLQDENTFATLIRVK